VLASNETAKEQSCPWVRKWQSWQSSSWPGKTAETDARASLFEAPSAEVFSAFELIDWVSFGQGRIRW
jgi:hypothetical protein